MIKLNLGSGPHPKEGWDNLDLIDHPGVIKHDLTTTLPYPDNSVSFAFSEHFLEHLTREQGLAFLKEVRRVLKPGGVFRIVVPSLLYLVDKYLKQELINLPGVWEPKTPCQMLNEGMREWSHQFMFDGPELNKILIQAKYSEVSFEEYRSSSHFQLFGLEIRPYNHELIIEATK